MPTPFPTRVLDGALVNVDYWNVGELADMFNMSPAVVRRRIKAGEWEVFEPLAGTFYMNAEQIEAAVASMTHRVGPDLPEAPAPPRLGVPVAPEDLEGIR